MASVSIPSDAFIILQKNGPAMFAKNSHRPQNEVQEIIYVEGGERSGDKIKCTYIEVEGVSYENSVILSKPAWMWGAEMGSNNKNVSIGNIGVISKYNEGDADMSVKRLLGTDLVRLGLERGSSAEDSLNIIVELLEKYGQGGPCVENCSDIFYHNSFVIVDSTSAWVLETCGKFWAAEKVDAYKHVANEYVIDTNIQKISTDLQEKVKDLNLWDGNGEFSFSKCFSVSTKEQYNEIESLLQSIYSKDTITINDIFNLLRNTDNKICHSKDDTYPTQSSQVSCLNESIPSIHWFTGTPDPSVSVYKPFIFTPNVKISHHTVSAPDDPQHLHTLYKLHERQSSQFSKILDLLKNMEDTCVQEVEAFMETYSNNPTNLDELDELMKDCVETEVKFYR